MRYIDSSHIRVSAEWARKARGLQAEVISVFDEKGLPGVREFIAKTGAAWGQIRDVLKAHGREKCWYCESLESRSDMPVDHYRPKNEVYENRDHPGYWWLAFTLENYRLSCTFCNSRRVDKFSGSAGGKRTHFPLLDESVRVTGPDGDLEVETPLLLDPTVPADPGLLYFDDLGEAVPHPRLAPPGSLAEQRAKLSIEILHLNHPGLVDGRKRLNNELGRALKQAALHLGGYQSGDFNASVAFNSAMLTLGNALSDAAELSASARVFLRGHRADSADVETVLEMLSV